MAQNDSLYAETCDEMHSLVTERMVKGNCPEEYLEQGTLVK